MELIPGPNNLVKVIHIKRKIVNTGQESEIGLEKMRNEGMPFPVALFHPDVLAALKGDQEEKAYE